jgi:hypothetical protein
MWFFITLGIIAGIRKWRQSLLQLFLREGKIVPGER